ncbi:Uma2 family endonuclease [Chroococcidiopsis sp. CCMEE 29]|uniref:Uma2 family endonuclease n=1 Tax=Chroococcidiopsis sp. CCMEE 29 TaxID=155894 RepID=UPI002020F616|nr:Uma2 family endonuclease [Chroococcidiopsis sp. CCMEE 29]
MLNYNPLQYFPSAEELPDADDTPVDNELQILVPTLLRAILSWLWAERTDWFFGVNMGVYYDPKASAIVPNGFLSLGVERRKGERGRLSYVLWEENNVVPQLVIEFVSRTYGQEYGDKLALYAHLGVLYYVVYNPQYWKRDKHEPFELYRLEEGKYVRLQEEPVWLPEIGLGIGRGLGSFEGWNRGWLYWYDQQGSRFLSPEERMEQAEQRAQQERQMREELIARLRERGIDPDSI